VWCGHHSYYWLLVTDGIFTAVLNKRLIASYLQLSVHQVLCHGLMLVRGCIRAGAAIFGGSHKFFAPALLNLDHLFARGRDEF
jgi:hypothetical protein